MRAFDPDSPGARRFADAAQRIGPDLVPTKVTITAPVLDLPGGRTLEPGDSVILEACAARALIARGAARASR